MNAELIKDARIIADSIHVHSSFQDWEAAEKDTLEKCADALEAAEKRIAELEKNFSDVCNANGSLACERNELLNDVRKLQAQIPKWVSVKEHLPEESKEYNVYIQMGTGVEVPDFLGSNDLSYVTSMYFKKEQKIWLDEYDEAYNADLSLVDTVNDFHVTHWMPLPKKPKGAK